MKIKKRKMKSKNKVSDIDAYKMSDCSSSVCANEQQILCRIWDHIKTNNHEELSKEILSLNENEKEEILNGRCTEKAKTIGKREIFLSLFVTKKENVQKETKPLFQAVMFGSFDCMETLMNLGANILQLDKHGWNIVHYLAVVSYFSLDYEDKAVKIYKRLLKSLQRHEIKALLHMEDKNGLRPLELAVHTGCLCLCKAILNTESVYLVKLERRGLEEKAWYDVSEYENIFGCCNRRTKSPLFFLTMVDRKVMKSPKALFELRHGILNKWSEVKFKSNIILIFIWFLIRGCCFVAFYCIVAIDTPVFLHKMSALLGYDTLNLTDSGASNDNISSNNTENCSPFKSWYFDENDDVSVVTVVVLYGILTTSIVISLGFDVVSLVTSFCVRPGRWATCFGRKKDLAVDAVLYRLSQTFFMLTAFIYVGNTLIMGVQQHPMDMFLVKLCLIISCYLSVWSILYFVQLLPSVGHFVNIVQRMQTILLNFILVYCVLVFPFPHVFLILLKGGGSCEVEGFETLLAGAYSVFKIMVNMLDFRQMYGATEYDISVAHIVFVFVISILLINFLVALLANAVSEVVDTGDVIMMLQRVSVACLVEKRIQIIFPCFYWLFKRWGYQLKDKKIYIVVNKITDEIIE